MAHDAARSEVATTGRGRWHDDPMVQVQTVRGPVDPDDLGFTLPHEHTVVQLWHTARASDYAGQQASESVLADELSAFAELGGRTLVDLTLPGIGRDPDAVRRLAEQTGLHVVVATGWYREPYYPAEALIDRRSVGSLADEMVREITEGIGDTGVRAGIIGEIGTDKPWVSAQEERVHRAAAQASRRTGLAITTHSALSRVGLEQLRLFDAEGADLSRVVVGHCDWQPDLDYYLELMATGATIELDGFGHQDVLSRGNADLLVELLLDLIHRGLERQVLVSQDVCYTENLTRYGGEGYTAVQRRLLPRLVDAGVPQATLDTITIENPRRLLTPVSPG
jgi:phosphotriesterase-related protein